MCARDVIIDYLVISERRLPISECASHDDVSPSLSEPPPPRLRADDDELRRALPLSADFARVSRGVVADAGSPTSDLERTNLDALVGVFEPAAALDVVVSRSCRRCVRGVTGVDDEVVLSAALLLGALSTLFARRARWGVVGVGVLLGGILRVGPGDLGGIAVLLLLLFLDDALLVPLSSGVLGSARRTGPGECDAGNFRSPPSGDADVFERLSRIEPVRTKFFRSGADALMLSALAASVTFRRAALVRRSVVGVFGAAPPAPVASLCPQPECLL